MKADNHVTILSHYERASVPLAVGMKVGCVSLCTTKTLAQIEQMQGNAILKRRQNLRSESYFARDSSLVPHRLPTAIQNSKALPSPCLCSCICVPCEALTFCSARRICETCTFAEMHLQCVHIASGNRIHTLLCRTTVKTGTLREKHSHCVLRSTTLFLHRKHISLNVHEASFAQIHIPPFCNENLFAQGIIPLSFSVKEVHVPPSLPIEFFLSPELRSPIHLRA